MSNIIQNNSNDRVCKTSARPKNQLRFKSTITSTSLMTEKSKKKYTKIDQ